MMTWFAAHVVIGMRSESRRTGPWSVWENVYLVNATSADEAHAAAIKLGELDSSESDLRIGGEPAKQVLAGVRGISTIHNPAPLHANEDPPVHGSRITYSVFEVENEAALRNLGHGDDIEVIYHGQGHKPPFPPSLVASRVLKSTGEGRPMTWFSAHIIIGERLSSDLNGPWLVWEDVVLLHTGGAKAAFAAAAEIGKCYAAEADLRPGGTPGDLVFVGVRKLINISNPSPWNQDEDRPVHGTEMTYSEFEVADDDMLRKLGSGEDVNVTYFE